MSAPSLGDDVTAGARAPTPSASAAAPERDDELRSAFDAMTDPCGVFAAERDAAGRVIDFRVVYVNPAWAQVHATTRERAAGTLLSPRRPVRMPHASIRPMSPPWRAMRR